MPKRTPCQARCKYWSHSALQLTLVACNLIESGFGPLGPEFLAAVQGRASFAFLSLLLFHHQHGEEVSPAASDLAMVLTRGLSLEHQKSSRDSLQYSSGYSTQTTTPSCSEDTIPSQGSVPCRCSRSLKGGHIRKITEGFLRAIYGKSQWGREK